jgi:hypothetical protein
MAAALPDTRADPCAALPRALALCVFGAVDVEERLRCREVCRAWCATLADHTLWLRLDLTRADGAACSEALLRAATARAGGQLQALRLTNGEHDARLREALCNVAAANSATLRELRVHSDATTRGALRVTFLEALLRAAPQLQILEADVVAMADETHFLLCNEPPFGPLRCRRFKVSFSGFSGSHGDALLALAADVAAHVWLTGLSLICAKLVGPAALALLDALVDASLERRLSAVALINCQLSPACTPALVRLLGGNALTELSIVNGEQLLRDEPAAALLGAALRANTSLTVLRLTQWLWGNPAATAVLLGALAGHRSLRAIDLSCNLRLHCPADAAAVVGAALGALVAANTPALTQLNVSNSQLGDVGMGPLVDALRHNTHLRVLVCWNSCVSEAFARDRLLPAVRANTALLTLTTKFDDTLDTPCPALEAAAALVAARAQQQPRT